MKAFFKPGAALICIVLLVGCGTVKQVVLHSFQPSLQRTYQQKALKYEKEGELQQALMALRVVQQLAPNDEEISTRLSTLEKKIRITANEYYRKGVAHHQKREMTNARRNLLIALRIDPRHEPALAYLRLRLPNDDNATYSVVRGDSYTKIATNFYNDPTKAYTIAYFNDLNPRNPLQISTELLLPDLPAKYLVPRKDIESMQERAQKALDQHRLDDVLKIASDIDALQPNDPLVTKLRDDVYFRRGKALLDRKQYTRAIAQLKQVSPKYTGRKEAIEKARRHLREEALETRVAQAQRHLDDNAYEEAIAICQEILTQAPFNRRAKTIFNAAHYRWGRKLLEEGKEAEAIDVLNNLDRGYQDTAQFMTQARAQLNARAEALYRKGVRFFLNEELEHAIDAWSEALKLNPNHPKAKQDIENAIRLLDKWRDLDDNGDQKSLSK